MSEEMLVCHCSPTLAGLKTGSLFSCPYRSKKKIIREIRSLNSETGQTGSLRSSGSDVRKAGIGLCLPSGKIKRGFFR